MAQLAEVHGFNWLAQCSDGEWWMFHNKPYFHEQTGNWDVKNFEDGYPIDIFRENWPQYFKKPKADSNITIRVNRHIKAAIKAAAARRGLSITAYMLLLATGSAEFSLNVYFSKQIFEVEKLLANE